MRNPTSRFEAACLALSLLCAACGSAPANPAAAGAPSSGATDSNQVTVSARGSVQGQTLSPQSAASATYINQSDFLVIVLSNHADYCASTTAGQTHANHRSLVSILFSADADNSTSLALGVGTYTISSAAPTRPGLYANAAFNATDAACQDILTSENSSATSGTITLTAVNSKGLAGLYDLKFGNDRITGTFSAPDCVAVAEQIDSGTPLTCEP